MKKILKTFIIIAVSLKITAIVLKNLSFQQDWQTLLIVAGALTVFEIFLKPIAKILLLPINLITLGAIRWIIDVLGLFLTTSFVDGFNIVQYNFPGFSWNGISFAPRNFGLIVSYIIVALFFNLVVSLFENILK